MTYADDVCDWLVEEGFTTCFFVAGGNIMHLLNAARSRFHCVPVVHEVTAGIAAEYFNEVSADGASAFALVTAGPGMTNIVTALAGAFLESRRLVVIGGQVKSEDLAGGSGVRQRGIQEIDGFSIAAPTVKLSARLTQPVSKTDFTRLLQVAREGRPGPVFIEVCLDVQGAPNIESSSVLRPPEVSDAVAFERVSGESSEGLTPNMMDAIAALMKAERPILLIGGGVSRSAAPMIVELARQLSIPCATTWNGADRIPSNDELYAGRPNTWGMRWANVVLQQADVILAAGTRLGLQQTGFNWKEFAPLADVIQIDIDPAELSKGHPHVDVPICGDVNLILPELMSELVAGATRVDSEKGAKWLSFVRSVRESLPLIDEANSHDADYWDPFDFVFQLSQVLGDDDVIVPCSSGGAFTVTLQTLANRAGQLVVSNKGLASMGYGLAGAVGASFAAPARRVILIEGDGGFAQNLQELATVARHNLPIAIFLFVNGGYASIRMTQRNYFNGDYLGCDIESGLGMPAWGPLFAAFGVPHSVLEPSQDLRTIAEVLTSDGPQAFIVPIDPEQTYFPKITSRVMSDGRMESQPLHLMSPDLSSDLKRRVMPYLHTEGDL